MLCCWIHKAGLILQLYKTPSWPEHQVNNLCGGVNQKECSEDCNRLGLRLILWSECILPVRVSINAIPFSP